jgi:hypothetical protein
MDYLLDAYVERRLHEAVDSREYTLRKQPTAKQTRRWLVCLAKKMYRDANSEFSIEDIGLGYPSSIQIRFIYWIVFYFAFSMTFSILDYLHHLINILAFSMSKSPDYSSLNHSYYMGRAALVMLLGLFSSLFVYSSKPHLVFAKARNNRIERVLSGMTFGLLGGFFGTAVKLLLAAEIDYAILIESENGAFLGDMSIAGSFFSWAAVGLIIGLSASSSERVTTLDKFNLGKITKRDCSNIFSYIILISLLIGGFLSIPAVIMYDAPFNLLARTVPENILLIGMPISLILCFFWVILPSSRNELNVTLRSNQRIFDTLENCLRFFLYLLPPLFLALTSLAYLTGQGFGTNYLSGRQLLVCFLWKYFILPYCCRVLYRALACHLWDSFIHDSWNVSLWFRRVPQTRLLKDFPVSREINSLALCPFPQPLHRALAAPAHWWSLSVYP